MADPTPPAPPKERVRRTRRQRERQLAELSKALAEGNPVQVTVARYAEQVGVTTRQGWKDYKAVRERWAEMAADEATCGAALGHVLLRNDRLFNLACQHGQYELARAVNLDRVRLLDLSRFDREERAAKLGEGKGGGGRATTPDLAKYKDDPVGYAREVLKVQPTPDQEAIARAVLEPPYRVLVRSGHNVGKSFLAAWLVNWWFDTRDPSWTVSTAPNQRSVKDILWTEIRLMRQRAGLPCDGLAPSEALLKGGDEHVAKGYTAQKGESFQGRHRERMFFVFDEAEGVPPVYWDAAGTMFRPGAGDGFLAILNPLTTTSKAAQEERATNPDGTPKWKVFTLSALDHPNVAAGLANRTRRESGEPEQPLPVPSAVTLEQLEGWLADWFEEVPAGDHDPATDVEWPPQSGKWLRPDGEGEARVLGRRPTAGAYGVWSERVWDLAARPAPAQPLTWDPIADLPEVGCDVARFGTDRTEMHARIGPCSLAHEDHSGWDTVRTAHRLKEMATEWAKWATARRPAGYAPVTPEDIVLKVDDTGVGGGVTDLLRAWGLSVVAVNAAESSYDPVKYPRIRDELWFWVRDRAKAGGLDLSRLPAKRLAQLRTQALAPVWSPTPSAQRQVESKDKTAERTGQKSPDGMDALNLAFFEPPGRELPSAVGPGKH